jgi:hypothetical protein
VVLVTHACNIAVTLIFGFFQILWLELAAALLQGLLLLVVFRAGRANPVAD